MSQAVVYTTAVQGDGKILIGGEFTAVGGNSRSRIAIKIKADVKGTDANITVNINPTSGGENKDSNNVSVLGISVQN